MKYVNISNEDAVRITEMDHPDAFSASAYWGCSPG